MEAKEEREFADLIIVGIFTPSVLLMSRKEMEKTKTRNMSRGADVAREVRQGCHNARPLAPRAFLLRLALQLVLPRRLRSRTTAPHESFTCQCFPAHKDHSCLNQLPVRPRGPLVTRPQTTVQASGP